MAEMKVYLALLCVSLLTSSSAAAAAPLCRFCAGYAVAMAEMKVFLALLPCPFMT
jgi:hypothetical protein